MSAQKPEVQQPASVEGLRQRADRLASPMLRFVIPTTSRHRPFRMLPPQTQLSVAAHKVCLSSGRPSAPQHSCWIQITTHAFQTRPSPPTQDAPPQSSHPATATHPPQELLRRQTTLNHVCSHRPAYSGEACTSVVIQPLQKRGAHHVTCRGNLPPIDPRMSHSQQQLYA